MVRVIRILLIRRFIGFVCYWLSSVLLVFFGLFFMGILVGFCLVFGYCCLIGEPFWLWWCCSFICACFFFSFWECWPILFCVFGVIMFFFSGMWCFCGCGRLVSLLWCGLGNSLVMKLRVKNCRFLRIFSFCWLVLFGLCTFSIKRLVFVTS